MKIIRLFVVLLLVSTAFAQTSPTESPSDKEKKQKELEKQVVQMLDQAVSEAATLKLPRNRAIVFGIAGDLFWKFDEKRSRQLFRDMANDIIVANQEVEKEKSAGSEIYYDDSETLRSDLLPLVAKHDADMALEMFTQTRSAKLTEALAKPAKPKKDDFSIFNFDRDGALVRQEVSLEQSLAVFAAEQSTDKAIQLLRNSLTKGVSYNVLELLNKINKKAPDKAKTLADEVIKKIVETDLMKKPEELMIAITCLRKINTPEKPSEAKAKRYRFSDSQAKDIANKLFTTVMPTAPTLQTARLFIRVMPLLEKALPEKSALLKQRKLELNKKFTQEIKQFEQINKIWNSNSTVEELLAEIPKLDDLVSNIVYESLGKKIAKIEDETRAKKLIEQIPDDEIQKRATETYESAKIGRIVAAGNLETAKKMIGNLDEKKNQVKQLVALAIEFNKKNSDKDRETAANLMKDATDLINEFAEDEDEVSDLMEVVKGYATINPNEAFRLFAPIIDQINEFVQASATLSKYNKNTGTFKKGELIFSAKKDYWSDRVMLFRYVEQMQILAKADLIRMNSLSDKFQRSDARTIVKLFVAQGFLKDDKEDEEKQFSDDDTDFYFGY
jgi:hypothetical protein